MASNAGKVNRILHLFKIFEGLICLDREDPGINKTNKEPVLMEIAYWWKRQMVVKNIKKCNLTAL